MEDRDHRSAVRRVSVVGALLLGVAVIAVPFASGRAYRRWMARNDPFEGLDDLLLRLGAPRRKQQEISEALDDLLKLFNGATG